MSIKLNIGGADKLKTVIDGVNAKVNELRMLLCEAESLVLTAQAEINLPSDEADGRQD